MTGVCGEEPESRPVVEERASAGPARPRVGRSGARIEAKEQARVGAVGAGGRVQVQGRRAARGAGRSRGTSRGIGTGAEGGTGDCDALSSWGGDWVYSGGCGDPAGLAG